MILVQGKPTVPQHTVSVLHLEVYNKKATGLDSHLSTLTHRCTYLGVLGTCRKKTIFAKYLT